MLRIWRCDCALCVIGNEFTCRQPHNPSAPSYEGLPLCPKDKNHSPFHGEKPLKIVIYRLKAICQYSKRHSVGTCLWHVSMQTAMYQRIGNMPKACPYVIMRPPIVADCAILILVDCFGCYP